MSDSSPKPGGLLHSVFLERAAELDSPPQSRLGQAAFLVLRLVDLLAGERDTGPQEQLFRYQAAATERYCREEVEPAVETDHLLALVRGAGDAFRRRRAGLLAPAMLGYATFLEDAARYEEALDVLQTLERASGTGLESTHTIATALQTGRISRKAARFDEADTAYERAAALATAAGDRRSELLSRLGRANVFWGRGNLAESERWNREALRDARAAGEPQLEALAEHGLGVTLDARGQGIEAVSRFWRAFKLYEDAEQRLRALHDLGFALARLGAIESAERALRHVVDNSQTQDNVLNATVELMHCASFRRDRVGFTRWRTRCEAELARMAPNILVDYHLKVGVGLARFGQFAHAATELENALLVARTHGLHEFEFRIDRVRTGLRDCEALELAEHDPVTEPMVCGTALGEVASALASLTI